MTRSDRCLLRALDKSRNLPVEVVLCLAIDLLHAIKITETKITYDLSMAGWLYFLEVFLIDPALIVHVGEVSPVHFLARVSVN